MFDGTGYVGGTTKLQTQIASFTNPALDQFISDDTGLVTPVAGSVAKLSQGAG